MSVLNLKEENFEEEVLKSEKTVLVDFYADWCGPCKMMSPVIDGIAEGLGDKIKVGKINTELAEKYNIMSIPTVMVFKGGELVKTFIGVTSKDEILSAIV